jgi:hypothetical protein
MKFLGLVLAAMLGANAPAGIYYQGTVTPSGALAGTLQSGAIPDGNVGGIWNTMDLSGAGLAGVLTDITVTLNLSGGCNGDLYAYLSFDGKLVPLLNRIGLSSANVFASSGTGLNNVTLSDSASVNIHAAGNGVLSGSYAPDGRNFSPLSSAGSFDPPGSVTLDDPAIGFGGLNPNGIWTLFVADVSAGGGQATLTGWSLEITTVPEPVNLAFGCCGALAFTSVLIRSLRARWSFRRRNNSMPPAKNTLEDD